MYLYTIKKIDTSECDQSPIGAYMCSCTCTVWKSFKKVLAAPETRTKDKEEGNGDKGGSKPIRGNIPGVEAPAN